MLVLGVNPTYFVVYVGDVHAVEDVILEIVPQYPSQDIKGNVGPGDRF